MFWDRKKLLIMIPALRITVKPALGGHPFVKLKVVAQNRETIHTPTKEMAKDPTNFGWLLVSDITAVMKLRREARLLVVRSLPCCAVSWRRYCCLTSFFSIVDTCLSCEDAARQSCAMMPRWWMFGHFLHPVFSASHLQHISDMHPKFALRRHHVWKYGRHSVCNGWE